MTPRQARTILDALRSSWAVACQGQPGHFRGGARDVDAAAAQHHRPISSGQVKNMIIAIE